MSGAPRSSPRWSSSPSSPRRSRRGRAGLSPLRRHPRGRPHRGGGAPGGPPGACRRRCLRATGAGAPDVQRLRRSAADARRARGCTRSWAGAGAGPSRSHGCASPTNPWSSWRTRCRPTSRARADPAGLAAGRRPAQPLPRRRQRCGCSKRGPSTCPTAATRPTRPRSPSEPYHVGALLSGPVHPPHGASPIPARRTSSPPRACWAGCSTPFTSPDPRSRL